MKPATGANRNMNFSRKNPAKIIDFGGILVRVERLELSASRSQSARATNCAIPGYLIFRFLKILLSVVNAVVKCNFEVLFNQLSNPASDCVPKASGISAPPAPDSGTAFPNQARYQLRYTRIFHASLLPPVHPKGAPPTAHGLAADGFNSIRYRSENCKRSLQKSAGYVMIHKL